MMKRTTMVMTMTMIKMTKGVHTLLCTNYVFTVCLSIENDAAFHYKENEEKMRHSSQHVRARQKHQLMKSYRCVIALDICAAIVIEAVDYSKNYTLRHKIALNQQRW